MNPTEKWLTNQGIEICQDDHVGGTLACIPCDPSELFEKCHWIMATLLIRLGEDLPEEAFMEGVYCPHNGSCNITITDLSDDGKLNQLLEEQECPVNKSLN